MNEQPKRLGRPPRQVEVASARRRRDDTNFQQSAKMPIPDEIAARLKAEGRTVRWANDEGNRIHNLTVKDDYDKVDGVAPVPVGTDKTGKPIMAHLLSKPDAFIAEDRAKAENRRRATESAMAKGKVPAAVGAEPAPVSGAMGAETYVDSATSIGRGNQIIE